MVRVRVRVKVKVKVRVSLLSTFNISMIYIGREVYIYTIFFSWRVAINK